MLGSTKRKRAPEFPRKPVSVLVAGARYVALEKTRTRRWVCELPFEALGRALDALWEKAKLRLIRVRSGEEPR